MSDCSPHETLPFKRAIWDAQQASRSNMGTLAAGTTSFVTADSQVTPDDEELFRLQVNRAVLWMPVGAKKLQVRLMVCAHMKEAGHRGVVATLQRQSEYYCCWFRMEEHVTVFIRVSIAWILKRGRRCLVRLRRPCTAPGRAKSAILTLFMLE